MANRHGAVGSNGGVEQGPIANGEVRVDDQVSMLDLMELIRSQKKELEDSKRREQELKDLVMELRGAIGGTIMGAQSPKPSGSGSTKSAGICSNNVSRSSVHASDSVDIGDTDSLLTTVSPPPSALNPSGTDWKELAVTLMTTKSAVNSLSEKPTFSGNDSRVNPVHFLDKFEEYWSERRVVCKDKLKTVLRCLKENAEEWATLNKVGWSSYDQFRADFLGYYWSESTQMGVLTRRLGYSYQNEGKLKMSDFFVRQFNELKTINVIQNESMMLNNIMRQFPSNIRSLWGVTSIKTTASALQLLRREETNAEESRTEKRFRYQPYSQGPSGRQPNTVARYQRPTVNVLARDRGPLALTGDSRNVGVEESWSGNGPRAN